MTGPPTADEFRIKIGRAYKHLEEYNRVFRKFKRSKPYTIRRKNDTLKARHIIRCKFNLVPADIHLSISDAIHSLRSALDQLAWRLAKLTNPTPGRNVCFPIHRDRSPESERRFREAVWDIPCEAVEIIKELQPYNRGDCFRDHPLWHLVSLSNIDKHKCKIARCIDSGFTIAPSGYERIEFDNGFEVSWPISYKNSVKFEPQFPTLKFGDPFDSSDSFPLEVTINEVAEIYRFIREDVGPRFTGFFPPPPDA